MSRPTLTELRDKLRTLEEAQERYIRCFGLDSVITGDQIHRTRLEIELAEAERRPFRFLVRTLAKRLRQKGGA